MEGFSSWLPVPDVDFALLLSGSSQGNGRGLSLFRMINTRQHETLHNALGRRLMKELIVVSGDGLSNLLI